MGVGVSLPGAGEATHLGGRPARWEGLRVFGWAEYRVLIWPASVPW